MLSASLLSLALVAPLVLAFDRHLAPDALAQRRHLDPAKRQYGAAYGAPAAPAAPAVSDMASSWSSSAAASAGMMGGDSAMAHDSAAMATGYAGTSSYDTANWAPSETASASKAWGGGGGDGGKAMDQCVQQCMAASSMAWPAASATDSMASAAPPAASGSAAPGYGAPPSPPGNDTGLVAGPGQVVVAPKKGDLRMVPFNIAAKPGETVEFVWGAGPHTVTQSSAASICNASQAEGAFKSGMQNASFTFPVKVKDDKPVFYYCAVAMHCKMGMFGLINGQVSLDGNSSFGSYMKTWAAKSKENQQMWDETVKITIDFPDYASWGDNLSTEQFEDWALPMAMESTLMTRQYFALNALAASTNGTSASSPSSPTSAPGGGSVDPSATDGAASSDPSASSDAQVSSARALAASTMAIVVGALGVGIFLGAV
ncbi:hypothetical protein JCM8208_003768 [Rhodotorula glutinis]